jgi:ankyrin repeat protein
MKREKDVVGRLGQLPKELLNIYAKIYEQIAGDDSTIIAERALKFLVCGQKPIPTAAFLSVICPKDSEPVDAETLLDICCNLVVQDHELDVFRLSHLSVREYLESRDEYSQMEANTTAAETCLSHLLKPKEFEREVKQTPEWDMVLSMDDYATIYWPLHCQLSGENRSKGELKSLLKSFLPQRKVSTAFSKWMDAARIAIGTPSRRVTLEVELQFSLCSPPKPFFLACVFNLIELVERDSSSVKEKNEQGLTGLHIACSYGYDEIVRLLLYRGAEIIDTDVFGQTPLTYALQSGHVKIVEMLLDHYKNIKITDELMYYSFRDGDDTKMLELLLDRDDTLIISEDLLRLSIRAEGTKNLEFLCDQDREVRITNAVVQQAVSYGNIKALEVLLRENEDLVVDEETLTHVAGANNFIPGVDECLNRLLTRYLETRVLESVLEAAASNLRLGAIKILFARDPKLQVSKSLLEQAVRSSEGDIVECLLSRYSDLRISESILVAAAENEECGGELVKLLLNRNSDAQVSDAILLAAAQNQNCGKEVVEFLLGRDSNLRISEAVLVAAAGNRYFDEGLAVAKLLLSRDKEPQHIDAIVRAAITSGNQDLLGYLLDQNKQIQITEKLDVLSFELNKYSPTCNVLLDRNRDLRVSEKILRAAAKDSDMSAIENLLARGGLANISKEIIISAIETNAPSVAELLLDQAVGMQIDEDFVKAAITCRYYSPDFMDDLLKRSANKVTEGIVVAAAENTENHFSTYIFEHLLDKWRSLPITETVWMAACGANNGVLKLLIERGEKPPAVEAILEAAANRGQVDAVQLLLERAGTDISSSKWSVIAQLFNAAYTGDEENMQKLLSSGVDPEMKSKEDGWTPLIAAASEGHQAVVKLLLGNTRLGIESADNRGETALFLAAENGHTEVVRLLLEKGANPSPRDKEGSTPLSVATENNHEEVVELLKTHEKA